MEKTRRAWKEIDLENLRHNVNELKKLLPRGCMLMPAVKADAYGHGAVPVARELQRLGIRDFCVASLGEGIRLRRAGIRGQILILGYTPAEGLGDVSRYHLTQTVVDEAYARELASFPGRLQVQAAADTGMHRLGIPWDRPEAFADLWGYQNLNITGIFSHLCVSDGDSEEERLFTEEQGRRYRRVLDNLPEACRAGLQTHLLGSYGILRYPELAFGGARPGIILYGVCSTGQDADQYAKGTDFRPVLSLKARIACVRDVEDGEGVGYGLAYRARGKRRIAVASIGYADGIPRALSGKGHALVRGVRTPIVGKICMDQLFLDVTRVPGVRSGDEAVFIGESMGRRIRAEEMADEAGTITNELLSRLGKRPDTAVLAEKEDSVYNNPSIRRGRYQDGPGKTGTADSAVSNLRVRIYQDGRDPISG